MLPIKIQTPCKKAADVRIIINGIIKRIIRRKYPLINIVLDKCHLHNIRKGYLTIIVISCF